MADSSRFSWKNFHPFFTPAGGVFLITVIVIFIRSMLARNAYEILLSSAALLFLLVLGITGMWKSRKLKSMNTGWKLPFPMTANAGENEPNISTVTGLEARIPLFFRLHFIVRGKFFPAGIASNNDQNSQRGSHSHNGCSFFFQTSAARGETSLQFPLYFPMSGIFQGSGFCRLRDIFGFYSFKCEAPQQRIAKIRSAPCFGKNLQINAQSGAEDRRNKTTTDEERYYMREYTPGDRFRDINWKSSEKVDALITRISPDNQEKVSRIEVYFRNYGDVKKTPLEALWMLDRAKARLSWFLRSLLETEAKNSAQSSYVFTVHAAGRNWEVDDSETLDAFLEDLAGLSFSAPVNETSIITAGNTGELYIFSTACDAGLNGFILSCNPRPISLFIAQPAEKKKKNEIEILKKTDFPVMGIVPFPRWFRNAGIKQMGVSSAKTEMIYTETVL